MYGLYLSASGAQTYNQYLEVLSNNLANAETPGFKREFAVVQARHSEAIEQGLDVQGSRSLNDVGGGVNLTETRTDFQQGQLKRTEIETDVALNDPEGDIFFVVEDDGKPMLTRAGNFRIDGEGVLRNVDGLPVLSDEHEAIEVDPRFPVEISPEGVVYQNGTDARTKLAMERPKSLGDLVKVGKTLFRSITQPEAVSDSDRNVKQGFLELSTTRPIQGMMDLIRVTRAYEANVRMMQNQDSTVSALVNRVLRQS